MSTDTARAWKARPVVAWLIRIVVFVAPIGLSIFVTSAMTRLVERPHGFAANAGWWLFMSLVGTSVLYATEVVMRRLLPLATLLKLTLVFPDHAPARFRVALRTGTPKQLERKLHEADYSGLGDTPQAAAEKLLELVAALSVHDRLTRGHCERVRAYTDVITKELGLSAEDASKMHWAAMIHDIGKLEVPAEILSKPVRLTDAEFEIIKTHPQAGARIAAPLAGWLGEWFHAIDHHHERWDGKGYPYGLSGTDIPIAGRIAAVADVYDVITAARSYKKPQPAAHARTELARCAGSQFDPEVVRAFLGVSLGRLRLMMGPLAWLSELPVIGRVPVAPAAGAAVSAVATAGALIFGGLLHTANADPAPEVTAAAVQVEEPAPVSPRAVDASDNVRSGRTTVIDLRAGSEWPDGATVRITEGPAVGTVIIDADASLRYTAPPNYEGTVVLAYELCNAAGCSLGRITIRVEAGLRAVDDERATDEDTIVSIEPLRNDDADATASISTLGSSANARVSTNGTTIVYEPAADFNGLDRFTYTVTDSFGNSAIANVAVMVSPVNDAPSFTIGAAQTINEDDPAQTVPGWLTAISAGPPDETTQTVTFTATVDDPTLFAATPTIAADGTLTYTVAANANGTTTIHVTATDSAGATTTEQTTTLTINPVNDAPSFTIGAAQTINEDDPAQTVPGWLTAISAGPPDETTQTVTFTATVDDPTLFAATPTIAADGTLTYTVAANANGTTTIHVTATDSAGATTTEQTTTLTINPVNDAPSFTIGAAQTINEDDPAQTVPGWLTAISAGPPDETTQTVTFTATVDDPTLFAATPTIAADGTLTYTVAANANGTTTIHVTATDSAGATTTEQTTTLTINPVNDAPSFTIGAAQTINEDDPAQTVPGWLTAISAGPPDETTQTVTFTATVDDPTLFAATPTIAADGTLTYTVAANANGTTTIHVTATDSAGATTTEQTTTLTINPVNDAPSFTIGAAQTINEDDPAQTVPGWLTAISAGPPDETTQTVTFTATVDDPTLFAATPTIAADGTLTYTVAANANGTTTIHVTATDSAGATTTEQTTTLTINPLNDAPSPQQDGYATQTNTPISIAAPGLLGNDWDEDDDPLTVSAIDDPPNGAVTFAADGSFTYTPDPGFTGSDTFTYTVDDGVGSTAQASITVTVSSTSSTSTYYLRPGAPAADNWQLSPSASTDPTVLDYDGDGAAGLTIDKSDGKITNTDPDEYQNFDLAPAGALTLNGPVTLHLAAASQGFALNKSAHIHAYLQDCATDGTNCVLLSSIDVHVDHWNLFGGWTERSFNFGSLNHTVLNGRLLRFKILNDHNPLLIAMSQSNASRIDLTL